MCPQTRENFEAPDAGGRIWRRCMRSRALRESSAWWFESTRAHTRAHGNAPRSDRWAAADKDRSALIAGSPSHDGLPSTGLNRRGDPIGGKTHPVHALVCDRRALGRYRAWLETDIYPMDRGVRGPQGISFHRRSV